jgi:hypothetical protein
MVLWLLLAGCAQLGGLQELDALPADFPLPILVEVGVMTRAPGGQVAVDVVFDTEDEARVGWQHLRDEATARGFTELEAGRVGKRDRVVLTGPGGRLELGCCPARADRQLLVLVSWWPAARP